MVKKRALRSYKRPRAKKDPYKKVLIVCEGSKTEPNYFKGLKKHLKLTSANIDIVEGDGKTTPMSIIKRACKKYNEEKRDSRDPFDKIFCVFDQNGHNDYPEALRKLYMKKYNKFEAITSVPAFEYWLLLHFKYTRKPFNSKEVLSCLKNKHPKYRKGDENIFEDFRDKLEVAKKNAARSLKDANSSETDNPSTKVHELVDYLQKTKKNNSVAKQIP